MCIAIFKPKDTDLPTKDILQNCWTANDDGAGFAFAHDGKVYTKKGFMTFEAFMDAFNFNNQKYNFKECGMLIHFRIATHGGTCPAMTHPFPIHSDDGALCKTDYISDYAIVHNGIISLTSDKARKLTGMSDTAVFVQDYLAPLSQNRGWFKRECNLELIETLLGTSNKMAIINGKGEVIHTRGFEEDKGIFYSNKSYEDTYYRYGKYYDKNNTSGVDLDNYYDKGYQWDNVPNKTSQGFTVAENETKSVGLMKVEVGETIEYDGFSQLIDSSSTETYFIDKSGTVFITDESVNEADITNEKIHVYYYILGTNGKVYSLSTNEKEFKADIWCYKKQFPEM